MMNFCVLGSGSKGNATLVKTNQTKILIDAGFSASRLKQKMSEAGIHPDEIDAILITHEHSDHCKGLAQFIKKHPARVYGTRHTCTILKEKTPHTLWTYFEKEHSFSIGDLVISPFGISHDAVDPVGFRIESTTSALGYLSDTGCITETIRAFLQKVDTLFIESNYDPELLQTTTKRPWPLKQRIASRHGHLSNEQAAELVEQICHRELGNIVLAHLSEESNTEEMATVCMLKSIKNANMQQTSLFCSKQDDILPWIRVKKNIH